MAMGAHEHGGQEDFWTVTANLARSPGHPFYERLNEILRERGFDRVVEGLCRGYYAERMGRPSLAPGVYFRMLLVGYFEGIDSERGIAWRCADSLALRGFLGYRLDRETPDHSTVSRTRRLFSLETHQEVFTWVVKVLAREDLVSGKTIGIDATTLEANAALRSIVRRDTGQSYREFLVGLAQASGIETPSREELARLDRKRPKKGSNDDWTHPHDPEARITKMKDGRTHLAHKAEQAVDMDTGAVLAVTVQPADAGDTTTLYKTLEQTCQTLEEVAEDPETAGHVDEHVVQEVVADKGYHSNETLVDCAEMEIRTYVSEPQRGRRRWRGKEQEQRAVYGNRRRIRGERGKRLLRRRGELLERPFAHYLDGGGMRRVHLRGRGNILKRLLIQVCGFNLGLVLRKLLGRGTPRGLADLSAEALAASVCLVCGLLWVLRERVGRLLGREMLSRPFATDEAPAPSFSLAPSAS
jgi:transposase